MNSVLYRGAGPLWTPGKPAAPSPLLANLVSYWKLDEASGTRNDSHGTNHLTDNGSVGSTTGKLGSAALFTGSAAQWLDHATNADLAPAADFTFAGWAWFDSTSGFPMILSNTNGSNGYELFPSGATTLYWRVNVGGVEKFATVPITAGAWFFFEAWREATAVGLRVNNGTAGTGSSVAGSLGLVAGFTVGNRSSHGLPLSGKVDALGLWSRTLTSSERGQLYNAGSGFDYPFN